MLISLWVSCNDHGVVHHTSNHGIFADNHSRDGGVSNSGVDGGVLQESR